MGSELRGAFVLVLSLAFFLVITCVLSLGMVMRPGRWSERSSLRAEKAREGSPFLNAAHGS
jgi:hypothetical protein